MAAAPSPPPWSFMWESEGEVAPGVCSVRWECPLTRWHFNRLFAGLLSKDADALRESARARVRARGDPRAEQGLEAALKHVEALASLKSDADFASSPAVPSFYSRTHVIRLATGGLLLHAPGPMDDEELVKHITSVGDGKVAVVLVPSTGHNLYVQQARERFPGALLVAPRGFRATYGHLGAAVDVELPLGPGTDEDSPAGRRTLTSLLGANGISYHHVTPAVDELCLLHEPSGTLLTCDLLCSSARHAPGEPVTALRGPPESSWLAELHALLFLETSPNGRLPLYRCQLAAGEASRASMEAGVDALLKLRFDRVLGAHLPPTEGSDAAHQIIRDHWAWLWEVDKHHDIILSPRAGAGAASPGFGRAPAEET